MDRQQRTEQVRRLLDEAGIDGVGSVEQDGWVIPLATGVRRRVGALLGADLSDARLVTLLQHATEEHDLLAPERPWAAHVAELLVERFVAEPDETFTLYYIPGCPSCRRVLEAVDRLRCEIDLRNVWESHRHRHDLLGARGSTSVPVLRCTSRAGERWVVEVRDIVTQLERATARQAVPA